MDTYAYTDPHIRNNGYELSTYEGFRLCNRTMAITLAMSPCSHSGIGRPRKNRKKDRDDSDFSGTLLVSLSLRRIYHMNQTPKHLVHGYLWIRLCFWRSHSHLTDLGSHHTTVLRISEKQIKNATRKGWGIPGPHLVSQIHADVGVFPHQRFHDKSGSYGLPESFIDICRKCTMHGIWKNDLMNSEESTKPFFMNTLTTGPFANWFHNRRSSFHSQTAPNTKRPQKVRRIPTARIIPLQCQRRRPR